MIRQQLPQPLDVIPPISVVRPFQRFAAALAGGRLDGNHFQALVRREKPPLLFGMAPLSSALPLAALSRSSTFDVRAIRGRRLAPCLRFRCQS